MEIPFNNCVAVHGFYKAHPISVAKSLLFALPLLQQLEPVVWQAVTSSKKHSLSVPTESSRGGNGKEQSLLLSMLL